MRYTVLCGDVSEVLPTLAPESFDAVLCDPPYEIGFMGKAFDRTGVAHDKETWRLIGQHLKPGAHLLAFGGTRTFHRLAVAIEDAGFEIRDSLCWLYGQGFPKSLDISKAIDKAAGTEPKMIGLSDYPGREGWNSIKGAARNRGEYISGTPPVQHLKRVITAPATDAARQWHGYGTALKPAWEPCLVAMKPTCGTFAENAIRWGVAGLAIDDCRIGTDKAIPNGTRSGSLGKEGTSGYQGGWGAREATQSGCNPNIGRWPANVILDEDAARALDEAVGERKAGVAGKRGGVRGVNEYGLKAYDEEWGGYGDTGGPSRFFYCAKSSRREREAGLEGFEERETSLKYQGGEGFAGRTLNDDGEWENTDKANRRKPRNHHPTVKPLALCEYLARLILPPKRDTPRRLLVPFSGSGSEMIGALLAGWDEVVGIEREAEYVAIAEARLAHWTKGKAEEADGGQMELIA